MYCQCNGEVRSQSPNKNVGRTVRKKSRKRVELQINVSEDCIFNVMLQDSQIHFDTESVSKTGLIVI
jgi:hypothetical protein